MPKFQVTIGSNNYQVDAQDESALPEIVDTISKQEGMSQSKSVSSVKSNNPLPNPDQSLPAPIRFATQLGQGVANTLTGGGYQAFQDWLSKNTGTAPSINPSSVGYNVGRMAGFVPLGMGATAAMGGIAGKVAPQLLAKTIPALAARGAIEGAAVGAYGTPENRIAGGLSGGVLGGVTNPISHVISNPKGIEDHILSTYGKVINPSVGKITNGIKLNEFQNKTVDAMKAITDNSDNLKFENPNTGAIESRLPRTRGETFEALQQTKQNIYQKYNDLQKSATNSGATVDIPSIAKKALDEVQSSRQYKLYAPNMVQDANKTMNRLIKSGKATPEEVQEDIKFLNNKMKGYYTKGDYNAANIYANYAANLRSGLDSSIEAALEKGGYQELKNQYASLKYVESDLAKAAARQLKNNEKSFGEHFSNPIALAEMARGILTKNPAEFGAGLAIKGFSTLQKALNNPDWRIANMFKNISKSKVKP